MKTKTAKFNVKSLLKIIGPLLLIFFVFYIVDFASTIKILQNTNLKLFLGSFFLFPFIIYVNNLRWWIVCKNLEIDIKVGKLYKIFYLSWFIGMIPPGGMSAVAKIFYIQNEGNSYLASSLSIILEKLFDILGLFVFGLLGMFFFPLNLFTFITFSDIYIVFSIGFIFLLAIHKTIWNGFKWASNRYLKNLDSIGKNLETYLEKFWGNFGFSEIMTIITLSVALGLLRSFALYLLACALSIDISFGFIIGCRALIGIVNIFPITFNGLGTRDSVLILAFPLVGLTNEMAISLGLLAFLWAICFKLSGFFFWLQNPLPFKAMRS